jgi:hypothetical protein
LQLVFLQVRMAAEQLKIGKIPATMPGGKTVPAIRDKQTRTPRPYAAISHFSDGAI